MEVWYITTGDAQRGPFVRESIESMLQSRSIDDHALVWRSGMLSWEPLAAHFDPGDGVSNQRGHLEVTAKPDNTPVLATATPAAPIHKHGVGIVKATTSLIATVALCITVYTTSYHLNRI